MHGAWCMVHGAWCMVLGAMYAPAKREHQRGTAERRHQRRRRAGTTNVPRLAGEVHRVGDALDGDRRLAAVREVDRDLVALAELEPRALDKIDKLFN